MDTVALHVKSNDERVRSHRKEIAHSVLAEFPFNMPSEIRTIGYLDDRDIGWLKQMWGGDSNRGIHWPIRGQGLHDWPQDMWDTIAHPDPLTGTVSWPYASVIYLHGSTCESDIQLAMTLSHELQHFVQFATDQKLWAIHVLLAKLPNLPTHNLRHWFDLPNEIEARIVSKRVAESLFGKSDVEGHIARMMERRTSEEDAADWRFIRGLDPNSNYDLRQHTIPLVEEYRDQLEILKRTTFANDKEIGSVDLSL